MNILFKETVEADLEELGKILNYYIVNTSINFHLKALDLKELKETLIFKEAGFNCFTIFLDDKICGFVQITQHKKREAYNCSGEISVYLDKECTNKGIGKQAFDFIENYARLKQFHSLISTICGENIASIKLAQNFGYEKCAHYKEIGKKFYRYLDVVAYQKILD